MKISKIASTNMRLTSEKPYWEHQLAEFAENTVKGDYKGVEFGKQDSRGAFSICFFDARHCVPKQILFAKKEQLLGYVQGYNMAKRGDLY